MPVTWIESKDYPGFKSPINWITVPAEAWVSYAHPMTLFLDAWTEEDLDMYAFDYFSMFYYCQDTKHISQFHCQNKRGEFMATPVWCVQGATFHLPGYCPFDPANFDHPDEFD